VLISNHRFNFQGEPLSRFCFVSVLAETRLGINTAPANYNNEDAGFAGVFAGYVSTGSGS
jgi:hypothetical protein